MAGVGYKYYFNSFFNNILLSAGWLIMAGTMFVFGWLLPLVGLILGVKGFKKQPNSNYIAQIGIFLAILEIYFYWLFFF